MHAQVLLGQKLPDPVHTWWQDGIKCVHTVHAQVADGECPAVVFLWLELLGTSALHQVSPVPAELVDVCLVCVLQHWGDQAAVRHGHS